MGYKMHFALVNTETNVVENVIDLEDGAIWSPPQGHIIVPYETGVSPGATWNGTEFIPVPPPPPPAIEPVSDGIQNVIG